MLKIDYQEHQLVFSNLLCDCGMKHAEPDLDVYIGSGIIPRVATYLGKRDLGKNVLLVTDNVVYPIAGKQVQQVLTDAGYQVELCLLEREGELIPDETALGEILLTMTNETEFLLAVGSGSLTDLTRYVAHVAGKPFAVVGTAPSMDGYTSVVAPLTFGNLKLNKPATYPKVLVCDLEIMAKAPYKMLLAGFGDVMGKYIAKADWILGSIVNQEPICPTCIELITRAVDGCIRNIDGIKQQTVEGVKGLIEGLILAGVTILIIGNTRPVASNEHGMAHYWEMMKLLAGEEPASHGLAVGVGTIYALKFYESFFQQDFTKQSLDKAKASSLSKEEREAIILEKYGAKIGRAIIKGNPDDFISWEEQQRRFQAIVNNHELIKERLAFLPSADQMIEIYQKFGAPWKVQDLDISQELLYDGLAYAKDYRSRYTVFKSANELGILEELVQQTMDFFKGI